MVHSEFQPLPMTLQSSQERCNCLPYSLAALIFAHHAKLDAREGDGVTVGDTDQLWVPDGYLCARQLPRRRQHIRLHGG